MRGHMTKDRYSGLGRSSSKVKGRQAPLGLEASNDDENKRPNTLSFHCHSSGQISLHESPKRPSFLNRRRSS